MIQPSRNQRIEEWNAAFLTGRLLYFGVWLKECRLAARLTQQQLADKLFCSVAVVSRAENRNKFSEQLVRTAGKYFGIREDDLPDFMDFALGRRTPVDPGSKIFDPQRYIEVGDLLNSMGKIFTEALKLDTDTDEASLLALFRGVKDGLWNLASGVYLHPESGTLIRLGVPHVLLRQETVFVLTESLTSEQLYNAGTKIGEGAAQVLIGSMESSSIRSIEHFIELWNYWDRTGGWGELTLTDKDGMLISGAASSPEEPWFLKVRNNFLSCEDKQDEEDRLRLNKFWCGYIYGFLKVASSHEGFRADSLFDPAYVVERVDYITKRGQMREDMFAVQFALAKSKGEGEQI